MDIVDPKRNPKPDLSGYRNIIIGSSVAMGRWTKEALGFLERDFEGKKAAVFVSSGMAGDPKSYDEAFQEVHR